MARFVGHDSSRIYCTFGPDTAAVSVDHPLDRGRVAAATREFVGGLESLAGPEELAGVLHSEADAAIPHRKPRPG